MRRQKTLYEDCCEVWSDAPRSPECSRSSNCWKLGESLGAGCSSQPPWGTPLRSHGPKLLEIVSVCQASQLLLPPTPLALSTQLRKLEKNTPKPEDKIASPLEQCAERSDGSVSVTAINKAASISTSPNVEDRKWGERSAKSVDVQFKGKLCLRDPTQGPNNWASLH